MIATLLKHKYKVAIISLLILAGFLLRIIPVITDSVHFSFDQGLDLILVKDLFSDHNLALTSRYSGLQGVLMGPLWTWFLGIGFIFSGGNPAAGIILLSLLSVIGALLTYLLFRKIIGEAGALITLCFCLFAPSFVGPAKVVLSPHPLIYIFSFFIWLCYKIFFEKQTKWLPLLGLTMGIFFQFEIAFAVFVPVSLFIIVLLFPSRKLIDKRNILLSVILFAVTFVPQLIFDLRNDFLITRGLLSFIDGSNTSLYTSSLPINERIFERIKTFVEDGQDFAFFIEPVVLLIPVVLITIFGWFKIFKDNSKEKIALLKILVSILVAFFVCFTLYKGPLWSWYRAGLPIVYVFLLTIPMGYLWGKKNLFKVIIFAVLAIYIAQSINPKEIYGDLTDKHEGVTLTRSQKEVLDYIYADSKNLPFASFVYTPPVYDYIWQYQFWNYGQEKYGRLPNNFQIGVPLLGIGIQSQPPTGKENLIYLIIEPNIDRPWEADGWRKNYIKVGKVISSKKFPSGLVVEKRVVNEK